MILEMRLDFISDGVIGRVMSINGRAFQTTNLDKLETMLLVGIRCMMCYEGT